jgi:hypothetical protein
VEEALKASRREQEVELARELRAEWSRLAAHAQEITRKTQELLQAIKEHEGTDGLMFLNFREPKCRSTILLLQAEHALKRARSLEGGAGDIGERVDVPIAGPVGGAWNPPWARATTGPEPAKPFLPGKTGWPTKLPKA